METARLETFSDGVFAIAITLLVLLFDVPRVSEGRSLGHVLAHQWPSYASYVVSFVTIGIIWVNHHTLFRHIVRVDRVFLFEDYPGDTWGYNVHYPDGTVKPVASALKSYISTG